MSLFVRDAQALSHAELSHLIWRVASRATLRGVTLTTRFAYDPIYCGSVSGIVGALETSPETDYEGRSEFKVDGTVPSLENDSLDSFSGLCIVPTARDAHGTESDAEFRGGEHVFVVNPPLYGKVNKRMSFRVSL